MTPPKDKGKEAAKPAGENAGKRAVFASQTDSENGFDLLGIYEGSPKDAKKAALREHPEVKERMTAGETVSLAAPPAAGWAATLKEVKPPDPEDFKGL